MDAVVSSLVIQVTGVLYILLTLAVWSLLRVPRHAVSVRLWIAGAFLLGAGFLLSAHRHQLPHWAVGLLLNGMAMGSQYLRILALRRHMGLPLQLRRGALIMLGVAAGLAVGNLVDDTRLRTSFACGVLAALSLVLAWHAATASRRSGSRSARLLAICEYPLALMLLFRAGVIWLPAPPLLAGPLQIGVDWLLLLVAIGVTAIYSNLAYMGLLLDDSHHDEHRARADQATEARARQQAVSQAEDLQKLLHQRDRLAHERQRTLDLLAHEIRQPLHNAGGALQAASSALRGLPQEEAAQAQQRVMRAQAVLGNVRSVLDNTLAAADLLTRQTPLKLHELELRFLIDLVLGDLTHDQRHRIQLDWQTDLRVVEVEPGLMRLALRNLLNNALRHGDPQADVVCRIAEQDAPPALVLEVRDHGPGMTAAQIAAATGPEQPADQMLPAGGQGLTIVREVAQLHGGQLRLENALPSGLRASLILPLPG